MLYCYTSMDYKVWIYIYILNDMNQVGGGG